MGLAASHRTAQEIHRESQGAETYCTSQGTGTPCTRAEVVVAVVVVVVVIIQKLPLVNKLKYFQDQRYDYNLSKL